MRKTLDKIKFIFSQKRKEKFKMERIFSFLEYLKKENIIPTFYTIGTSGTRPEVKIDGNLVLMFSSNNYLGLSEHPAVIAEAEKMLKKHGLGPGGSRFLCGNVDIIDSLDKKTAEFVGFEDVITFPTGYMANAAIFEALMDPLFLNMPYPKGSGIIFSDELNHGSIIEGCKLSSSKKIVFNHNDFDDLEKKIAKVCVRSPKMIVTEGVYSPEGELTNLPRVVDIAKKYNAILMVDDAHGIGIFGSHGGGAVQHYGLENEVDILMGSYDKTFGGLGGFLAGKRELIEYLRVVARPYLFSSAIPGVIAGGLIKALEITASAEGDKLRIDLFKNAEYLRKGLSDAGFVIIGDVDSPVIPILIGDEQTAIKFSERIFRKGIYAPSFRWPAVAKGKSRIRVTPMATHTTKHLDKLIHVFKEVGNQMNIV